MLKIIPFQENHIKQAARLVCDRYQLLREQEPLLPERYQEEPIIQWMIENICRLDGPGVAVIQDDKFMGFLQAWLMPEFKGKRSVYSPEWANGAVLPYSRFIYEEMYARIAAAWVAERFTAHYISIFASDMEAINGCHGLGFGLLGIDALRDLSPLAGVEFNIDIQQAGPQHLDQIVELQVGLRLYMKESPVFFRTDRYNREFFEDWMEDNSKMIWLAFIEGEPVAFLRTGPANDDVAAIIHDEKTTSIYGAFTQAGHRGKGIGKALLDRFIQAAHSEGYLRCAVDFETMNLLGSRFWLKQGFTPVSFSLLRQVDERVI